MEVVGYLEFEVERRNYCFLLLSFIFSEVDGSLSRWTVANIHRN